MFRTAYFGPQGTFTEQATRILVDTDDAAELVPMDTVPQALDAVRAGAVQRACVPVENSVEGAVPATLDGLADGQPLVALAEAVLPVRFSVLTRPGCTKPRTVASHPHALAQVREWLATELPEAELIAASSTAAAAVAVRDGQYDAAVTAPVAAEHYPLSLFAENVADVADARTRFLLVSQPGELPAPTGADRTSLAAVAADRVGSLAELLNELMLRGINLTRIESRPTKGRLGEYRFFLDIAGHIAEQRVGDAFAALRRRCADVRFLGSYPRADRLPADVPETASDADFDAAAEWLAAVRRGELA
ncbi:prephenate dehydratase [Tamaricihabitans halophyticus]|uniref:prephenate dehydratase n=1 Tax=Tamaricihabitans halophyticus TaxID=1262583 RepID=UPI001046C978|nr:prephenate dehydratase [Tamaricihabitans halophyticus]